MMVNRQGRGPGAVKQFDALAHVSGDVPGWAVEGGQAFAALARVAGGLSDRLGRLADAAAEREATAAGAEYGASSGAAYLRQQAGLRAADGKAVGAAELLRGEEGFRATPYWDVNAFRVGYGSDTVTLADGTVKRVTKDMRITRADAERDLARRLGEFSSVAERQTGGAFSSLPGRAKAALLSVAYNYGSLPDSVVAAVKGGDLGAVAEAVGSLSANPKRRGREAALIRGAMSGGRRVPSQPIVSTLPDKPLQLRHDGTIAGEAFDRAARNAYAWRLQAGLSTSMQAAFEANEDDPEALAGALAETHAKFAAGLKDPDLRESFEKSFAERSETYMRSARSKAETKMRAEERAAVHEGMAAQRLDIERQAVALGANPEGDRIVEREVARAGRAIDAAIAAGSLSPAEGLKQKQEVATSAALGRVRGVFEALGTPEERREFASGLLAEWTDGKGPLARLPFARVKALSTTLWNEAQHQINAGAASQRMRVSGLRDRLKDDIASIEATGKGIEDIDPAEVERVLGPQGLAEWQAGREQASKLWGAVSGMETAPADEIAERLAALEPQPGAEGFRDQEEVYEAAARKAKAVLKARADDPAAAVEASFPQMRELAAAADPQNPDSMQALVAGRLRAQEAVGIPRLGRAPLTNGEALYLARAVTGSADPRQQAQGMAELVDQVHAAYGPYAGQVLTQVLQARGMDKDMAAYGAQLFAKLRQGEEPGPQDERQGNVLSETEAAEKAGEAKGADAWPLPNYAQRQMLLEHPELAQKFDEKFGPGAAQNLLGQQRDPNEPVKRKEDGGTVTLNPDGTEDWTPDAR